MEYIVVGGATDGRAHPIATLPTRLIKASSKRMEESSPGSTPTTLICPAPYAAAREYHAAHPDIDATRLLTPTVRFSFDRTRACAVGLLPLTTAAALPSVMDRLKRHYGYAPFSRVFGDTGHRMDGRDQFFGPLQPTVGTYLASRPAGLAINLRRPLRSLAEWIGARSNALRRGRNAG